MADLTHIFEQAAQQRGDLGTDDALLSLRQLIDAARETEAELEEAGARVKVLQKQLDQLTGDLISGTLGKGRDEIDIDHDKRRRAAFEWLKANGHGGVIKRTLEIPLARHTPSETVERMRRTLVQHGIPFDEVEDVHHSTLGSLLRELVEQHKGTLPESIARLFRATQFRRAKLSRPKRRK